MTRICLFAVLVLYTFCAGATTMCVRNDKVVFGVSSQQAPTAVAYDNDTAEWSVYFDGVGVVSGVSSRSLISPKDGNMYGCLYASNGDLARENFQGRKDGGYTWCKITHPFESEWFYVPSTVGAGAAACVSLMTASPYGSRGVALKSVAMAD